MAEIVEESLSRTVFLDGSVSPVEVSSSVETSDDVTKGDNKLSVPGETESVESIDVLLNSSFNTVEYVENIASTDSGAAENIPNDRDSSTTIGSAEIILLEIAETELLIAAQTKKIQLLKQLREQSINTNHIRYW